MPKFCKTSNISYKQNDIFRGSQNAAVKWVIVIVLGNRDVHEIARRIFGLCSILRPKTDKMQRHRLSSVERLRDVILQLVLLPATTWTRVWSSPWKRLREVIILTKKTTTSHTTGHHVDRPGPSSARSSLISVPFSPSERLREVILDILVILDIHTRGVATVNKGVWMHTRCLKTSSLSPVVWMRDVFVMWLWDFERRFINERCASSSLRCSAFLRCAMDM